MTKYFIIIFLITYSFSSCKPDVKEHVKSDTQLLTLHYDSVKNITVRQDRPDAPPTLVVAIGSHRASCTEVTIRLKPELTITAGNMHEDMDLSAFS